MTRYMRAVQATSLAGPSRNGVPQGGGYRYRGIPGWNPAQAIPERGAQPGIACGDLQGTARGYRRHNNTGETACEPCLAAYRAYRRAQKKTRKKAAS